MALVFLGCVVCLSTGIDPFSPAARAIVGRVALNALSLVSGFTGARISFLPFKLCPVIVTGSSVLLAIALLWPGHGASP